MSRRAEQSPEEWYTHEVTSLLRACEHYFEKVRDVKSYDTHERARHYSNLDGMITLCKRWLNSDHTGRVEGWREVARLESGANQAIGAAAVWLQGQAQQRNTQEEK